jgi:acyl-CoA thioesterase-1
MKLVGIGIAVMILASTIAAFPKMNFQYKKFPVNLIRVACVGDSITEGSRYPSDLRLLLGTNYSVGNFGVGGSTVSLSSQKPYMDQPEFQKAKLFQPDIVVIMLGTNDANANLQEYNESFEDDYTKLVASFQNLESEPQIWIAKSPPIFNNTCNLNPAYFNENVIPNIENLANDLNLPTIDVHGAFGNQSDYFPDGIHPTIEGAALIATEVYNEIIPQDNLSSIP